MPLHLSRHGTLMVGIRILLYFAKNKTTQLMLLHEEDILDGTSGLAVSLEAAPTAKMNKESSENYFVPQPIYHKKLVAGKTLSSNALQSAIHQKIVGLKKKIKKQKRHELQAQLSVFTSIDFFNGMTKTDDQNNKLPADHYVAMVNVLADFELVHNL
ncbi:MAG: hypothetical protein HC808_19005 [Candidatus Competibacteraceae bacterium]|nr:hypothetical protein [Candidatus Competibacteraceae bacterium]